MAKKLGKLEKPEADKFSQQRKLFFVPLVFAPPGMDKELSELVGKYWRQAEEQLNNLESKMATARKIYHELVTQASEEGEKAIEQLNAGSYAIVKTSMGKGAEIEPIEDNNILMEFMDWSRCLSFGLQSQKVVSQVFQYYKEAQKNRNEHIARRIDETLKGNEVGILFLQPGHGVQFPADIQVFYVAPPSLDEIEHWQKKPESKEKPRPEEKPPKKKPRAKKTK